MKDLVERLRSEANASGTMEYGTGAAILDEAANEIERLRAALKEIADDPGGYPAEDAFDEVTSIARRALEPAAPTA